MKRSCLSILISSAILLVAWGVAASDSSVVLIKDINTTAGFFEPTQLENVAGTLFISADDSGGHTRLWKVDSATGDVLLVKDFSSSQGESPTELTDVDGTLYFVASDGKHGAEVWKSDGTSGGTVMVKDVNPGAASS